ncbi:MAG TPA: undecaprenyldiphospho-muramoylpentapeptide beta-N-acetylglucosaminyltransferase [Rhodanobacteraceae bacterium]|jgi:UDP-N-acetylglucosamine--N-acetylmuramyl-(pentapeptide) pyrophosphoryl-undecaprenol N-acetylglucosamine transferase|nr:undecaprenyldiphospho-muramoylpentapeptide beta-N-acetylglucosaminyltransferase [Rhodanobacteraceae bacterium]
MTDATALGPVMIMAGGTGGHIFPGLAVADELRRGRTPVIWIGGVGGLEQQLVPQYGWRLETLPIAGVRGKGIVAKLTAPFRLARAIAAALALFRRYAPRSVLSMGGYAAAPGGLAARIARIPLVVHEQNRIPGMTNRMLARFATRVLTGFADVFANGEWVGNPVRASIAAIPAPAARYAGREGPLRLLVLGGSQGAQSLNSALPEVLRRRGARLPVAVRHQCGAKHFEQARAAYMRANIEAEVVPFEDDMAGAYAWADLVICRSGALTLAELAAAGVPAILVPFPHAVDDHQTKNAEAMVAAGGARLVVEGEDFVKRLGAAFEEIGDRAKLTKMAEAARSLAKPDAARRIAGICMEVAA